MTGSRWITRSLDLTLCPGVLLTVSTLGMVGEGLSRSRGGISHCEAVTRSCDRSLLSDGEGADFFARFAGEGTSRSGVLGRVGTGDVCWISGVTVGAGYGEVGGGDVIRLDKQSSMRLPSSESESEDSLLDDDGVVGDPYDVGADRSPRALSE